MEGGNTFGCPPQHAKITTIILKIVEMVCTMLTFACSLANYWGSVGGAWVEFVGISCFVTVTIWLILYLVKPHASVYFPIIEFISYCVMTIMLFISGIVAAIRSSQFRDPWKSSVGAASFFAFASMVVCGFDTVFSYQRYRQRGPIAASSTTAYATTTTTTTSSEVRHGY